MSARPGHVHGPYHHGYRYGYHDHHAIPASGYSHWDADEWPEWLAGWRQGQVDRRNEGLPMRYEVRWRRRNAA
jgi:hypothetical protein